MNSFILGILSLLCLAIAFIIAKLWFRDKGPEPHGYEDWDDSPDVPFMRKDLEPDLISYNWTPVETGRFTDPIPTIMQLNHKFKYINETLYPPESRN